MNTEEPAWFSVALERELQRELIQPMHARFDQFDARMDRLEARMDGHTTEIKSIIRNLNTRMDIVSKDLTDIKVGVHALTAPIIAPLTTPPDHVPRTPR